MLCPFRKSLYCALPPLFRMLHSGHQQSRQLEQNNRLGVVWGGVGGSRVSSLDASKSRSETIKLTPDLHYYLWLDMIIMFLVLIGGALMQSSQKYQSIFQFNPLQMTIKLLKKGFQIKYSVHGFSDFGREGVNNGIFEDSILNRRPPLSWTESKKYHFYSFPK